MAKVKLQYKTATMKDTTTKEVIADKRRPYITGLRIYNLDELVKFALDNNYIEGAKYELAKGIVKGAIEAERALILAGNAVSIDNWVKYEPRLKGSVAANVRTLSAKDNQLVCGISALKEMKLSLDSFSWQLVDEGFKPEPVPPTPTPGDEPEIERGYSQGHGEGEDDGKVYPGTGFVLEGTNFAGAAVKITYRIVGTPSDVDVDSEDMTVTDTSIDIDAASTALQEAIQATGTLTFTVTTSAGSDTYDAVVME